MGARKIRERRRRRRKIILTTVAVLITLVYAFPMVWLILTSFKKRSDIFSVPPKFVFKPTLDNYACTIQRRSILAYLV